MTNDWKTRMKRTFYLGTILMVAANLASAAPGELPRLPNAWRVPPRLPEAAETAAPAEVQLEGFLAARVANNEKNRLLKVDPEPLLAGFRHKPGIHPWIGEHIGKWLHASTLAWSYTGDPELRAKMDWVVNELAKAQEPDGYLGTYVPAQRFGLFEGADWDVWSHKYNLIGLLTYYQYTGNNAALNVARKAGDLLLTTFGPDKKSILAAGTHLGMAATSVLEPMVLLYRATGDERYLEFARYIVRAWDEPKGPGIVAALLKEKRVDKTANAKAYEMLSNLVGLCELARATGDKALLQPVINAWEDIVAHRLYLTGGASQSEHFHDDYYLPNQPGADVSETCVTTTWIQLNSQLLRLTGEARYGDQLERTFLNHLAAAQRPDGAQWCYFTALEGTKPYGPGINCCVSSGPRGMALAPQHAFLRFPASGGEPESLAVNMFESAHWAIKLGGQSATLNFASQFPEAGGAILTVTLDQPAVFGLRVRTPEWARPLTVQIVGAENQPSELKDGWTRLAARRWVSGDQVKITFNLAARLVAGDHGNQGLAALQWGPFVLAYDEKMNPGLPPSAFLGLADSPGQPPFQLRTARPRLLFEAEVRSAQSPESRPGAFTTFADAGGDGGRYRVWLRAPGTELPKNDSLFGFAPEERSRRGNVGGSISDGDFGSFVVTFDARPQSEAWFTVRRDTPATIGRVVFAHGRCFHDGGWFDASDGKPLLQAQRVEGGLWETIGTLDAYPQTTATDARGLTDGKTFEQKLASPQKALALRVIGKPACGDNAQQAFASCAELQAFP
jgi:DUF1680 family protein